MKPHSNHLNVIPGVSLDKPTANHEETTSEVPSRGNWPNKIDFFFSCIAYAVGLGNVWRFPYLCYKNGGGAFLIPYGISMICCGIPLFFMEVALGQYVGMGGMQVIGQFCPILKGVGYASLTMMFWENIYYVIIVSWTFYYFVATFTRVPDLPWSHCNNSWNTIACSEHVLINSTGPSSFGHTRDGLMSPVEEFWERRVLSISSGLTDLGGFQWSLVAYTALVWVFVYFVIGKGIHKSPYIIRFTAIFPYVLLSILLIRGVTLEGADIGITVMQVSADEYIEKLLKKACKVLYSIDARFGICFSLSGLHFLVTPDWGKLLTAEPWVDGGTQIFYSYGLGICSIMALGSYNKFHHNCYRDAIGVCCVNSLTSALAGVVTFSVLGHLSWKTGSSIESVVKSGPGLAFLIYPEVVQLLPGAVIWAGLFFLMLLILGGNSQFCGVESLVVGLVDNWAGTLRPIRRKFTLLMCFIMAIFGLPMLTEGGVYVLQMIDFYGASGMSLLWTVFFQTIAIAWLFGTQAFSKCIREMINSEPPRILKFVWAVMAPVFMLFIFLFFVIRYKPLMYGRSYEYPWWGELIGFMISISSMIWIPGYATYYIIKTPGASFMQILLNGIKPNLTRQKEDQEVTVEKNKMENRIEFITVEAEVET